MIQENHFMGELGVSIMRPPVLKGALIDANAELWRAASPEDEKQHQGSRLQMHIPEIERLLMADVKAAPVLDDVPLMSSTSRSRTLVAVFKTALSANPGFGAVIRRTAPAVNEDWKSRTQRGSVDGFADKLDIVAAVTQITRTVENRAPRPRY